MKFLATEGGKRIIRSLNNMKEGKTHHFKKGKIFWWFNFSSSKHSFSLSIGPQQACCPSPLSPSGLRLSKSSVLKYGEREYE